MKNSIDRLKVSNFKSIKGIEIQPRRINLFIGMPNVGKSNLIEALSLFSAPYSQEKGLQDLLRYENFANLFFDNDNKKNASVNTNLGSAVLTFNSFNDCQLYHFTEELGNKLKNVSDLNIWVEEVNAEQKRKKAQNLLQEHFLSYYYYFNNTPSVQVGNQLTYLPSVKRYIYKKHAVYNELYAQFLKPPFGSNLFSIIRNDNALKTELKDILSLYDYQAVYRTDLNEYIIQKMINQEDDVIQFSYHLQADTLQRYLFHQAALHSNTNSILLFEEPEAHAFPTYIIQLADSITHSKDNQFFIATHSTNLINTLLEHAGHDEVAVFKTYYEDQQTKVKELSNEEKIDVQFGANILLDF